MLYPSIDSLLNIIDSKYTLVTLSAKRARVIQQEENQLIENPHSHKPVGIALEEILEGKLTIE
ncbi:DNA-directed RNA polymerase subunit omega [Pueribacillus theae]|uniref:DNA-directed RNA polymerase subunit omega n=1 Tax=Pueribacillus theae TaxID=2171751 RepID=A0A2U1K7F8_9BACI|nr:DNA-directed RNA polymerase subunit omega [Pueribacillus theae]PWA13456.1 DNA-directed RNA polymerase subunit omega [Pueribacillus theae]